MKETSNLLAEKFTSKIQRADQVEVISGDIF